jgi:hypothetical protein
MVVSDEADPFHLSAGRRRPAQTAYPRKAQAAPSPAARMNMIDWLKSTLCGHYAAQFRQRLTL